MIDDRYRLRLIVKPQDWVNCLECYDDCDDPLVGAGFIESVVEQRLTFMCGPCKRWWHLWVDEKRVDLVKKLTLLCPRCPTPGDSGQHEFRRRARQYREFQARCLRHDPRM